MSGKEVEICFQGAWYRGELNVIGRTGDYHVRFTVNSVVHEEFLTREEYSSGRIRELQAPPPSEYSYFRGSRAQQPVDPDDSDKQVLLGD